MSNVSLRVLTLNCWGLWWVAKLRPERIRGIVRFIRDNNCDIVFLQEVWVQSDFEFIRDNTSDIYQFAHNYKSGSLLKTSGIVILSKWSPKVIHFEPYSLNGSPFYFWHGDWFAGKGVAYARVDIDDLHSIHLFSTHTHAYYKENEQVLDQYSIHRVCQSYQLARFINFISDTTCNRQGNTLDLIIVAGDFNCTSSEMPYKIVTTMANLTDCLKASRSNTSNIIHGFKLKSSKLLQEVTNEQQQQRNPIADSSNSLNSSNISDTGVSPPETIGLFASPSGKKQTGDLFSLQEYRKKIAQLFFDSDTEEEDTTYCHPKNSFTGLKAIQKASSIVNKDKKSKSSDILVDDKLNKINTSTKLASSSSDISQPISETSHSSDNTRDGWSKIKKNKKKSNMRRIDFILCRLLAHGSCIIDRITVEGKDPQLECSLSDHEPVMVELKISSHNETASYKEQQEMEQANRQSNNNQLTATDKTIDSIDIYSTPPSTVRNSIITKLEETTGRITPANHFSINETYNEGSLKVMEQFQDILRQYYRYNGRYKFRIFIMVLVACFTMLPILSYYTIRNDVLPPSTLVLIWLFAFLIVSAGTLAGFVCYRIEQSSIEATLNDIACRINVAKLKQM